MLLLKYCIIGFRLVWTGLTRHIGECRFWFFLATRVVDILLCISSGFNEVLLWVLWGLIGFETELIILQ